MPSEADSNKILLMVAGINGAGKSTLNKQLRAENPDVLYINADDWLKDKLAAEGRDTHSKEEEIEAQAWANKARTDAILDGQSLITESVFSHPSRIEYLQFAIDNNFQVALFHVNVESADIAVERVGIRVEDGGHDVNEAKIRARYERCLVTISEASKIADTTLVIDNTATKPDSINLPLMTLEKGQITRIHNELPTWAKDAYKEPLEAFYEAQRELSNSNNSVGEAYRKVIQERYKNQPEKMQSKLDTFEKRLNELTSEGVKLTPFSNEKNSMQVVVSANNKDKGLDR